MEITSRIHLSKLLPPNPVTVELGVAEGLFSKHILEKWKPSKHYMVDLWKCHPTMPGDVASPQQWHNRNYNNVMSVIRPFPQAEIIRDFTVNAAQMIEDLSCDIVYVDACHSYECVLDDIRAWWPKVKIGGVMAFHDYGNPDYGVTEAVKEFAVAQGLELKEIPENGPDASAYIIKIK